MVRDTYTGYHSKRRKKANAAKHKLKTIAGRLVRELEGKLPSTTHQTTLMIFNQVLSQSKTSTNKVYSLHAPEVYCIAKGKAHNKYEYGTKGSITLTQNTDIIVGAMSFESNLYDGHMLTEVLNQTHCLTRKYSQTATVDREYKGVKAVATTKLIAPPSP